uniref:Uncharacterized protein n=1 Tax=Panagrolaimus sp. PS1159 TaxID=55785 RepID=A0AC35FIZ3_9BILA
MGSGCIEDVRINCGNPELGFRPKPDLFFAKYVIASVCVGENGAKKCGQSLPSYLQWVNQDVNNIEFGWGYAKNIQYKPDVYGTLAKTTPPHYGAFRSILLFEKMLW